MLSPEEERSDKLAAAAKKKLHKYQTKKVNLTGGLEQENIRLKEKLFKSEEQVEWMEHEIRSLRERNTELQRLMANEILSDGGESINFSDIHTLEAFEKEERLILEEMKRKLYELRERFRRNSAELCSNCMGVVIEI